MSSKSSSKSIVVATANASKSTVASAPKSSGSSAKTSQVSLVSQEDDPCDDAWATRPEFIYGGPFIPPKVCGAFIDTAAPRCFPLSGTFKKSFAYDSLKERMPVILTKVIDQMSKKGDEDSKNVIKAVSKLKSDLITNKEYTKLTSDSPEAHKWNEWIENSENHHYFNNNWLFTECYMYRKLKDIFETGKSLKDFDYFAEQKDKSFQGSMESICVTATEVLKMVAGHENKTAQLSTLLKLSLWANKCDLSLSGGNQVDACLNPIKMIEERKDKILADDSNKIAPFLDGLKPGKQVNPNEPAPTESPPPSPPKTPLGVKEGEAEGEESPPDKIPCPAKVVDLSTPTFDIVLDNAGYELFADLCVADFVLTNWVQRVRFHVKKIPWFVSDVTLRDFHYVIDQCVAASYTKPATEKKEGEESSPPPVPVDAEAVKQLGARWKQYLQDGKFIIMQDDFWTSPHSFKDMKKYDYNLYRKLQFANLIMFKGDLNYRKLVADINWNPYLQFEKGLQGFTPAPIVSVRTVKAEVICGLPKGKYEYAGNKDPQWMRTGDFGTIQFCRKKDPLKVADRPCIDYGDTCYGEECPTHKDMW